MKKQDQLLREIDTLKKRIRELENTQPKEESNSNLQSHNQTKEKSNIAGIPQFFQNIIEGVQDGFWVTDKNDVIFYTNKAMEKIAGISKDEIIGKNVITDFPKETTEEFNKFYLEAKKTLNPVWYQVTVKTPAGKDTWQNGWLIPQVKNKKFDGITCTARDVTKRVLVEFDLKENEEKYKNLIETASDAIYLMAEDGTIIETNKAACKMLGREYEEIVGQYIDSVDSNFPVKDFVEFWKTRPFEKQQIFETTHLKKDGSFLPVEVSATKYKTDNKTFYYGIARDITERKKAEKELRDSEAKFRGYIEHSPLGVFEIDAKGNYTNVNPAAQKITGYTKEELLKMNVVDFSFDKESREKAAERHKKFETTGILSSIAPFKRKNGDIGWWEINAVRLSNTKLIGFTTDITERINAEKTIKESEERFRQLIRNSFDMIVLLDADGIQHYVSESCESILGFTPEELTNIPVIENMIHPEDQAKVKAGFIDILNTATHGGVQYRHRHKNGSWVYLEAFGTNQIKNPLIESVILNVRDITERKKAEKKILETQFYLSKAQELGKIGTWNLDIRENSLTWTDENYNIFGVPKGTPLDYETFLNCVHPDDRDFVNEEWSSKMKTNDYDIEHRLVVDGKIKWVREKAEIEFDEKGEPVKAIGFTQDITERKMAEEALKTSESRFRKMFEDHAAVMLIIDPESGKIVDANNAASLYYGYSRKKFNSLNIDDINILSKEEVKKNRLLATTGKVNTFYFQHILKNKTIRDVQVHSTPIEYLDQKLLFSIIIDITERKQAEEALKESEEKFRNFAEQSKDAFTIINQKGDLVLWNSAMEEITGYRHKEIYNQKIWKIQSNLLTDDYPKDFPKIVFEQIIDKINKNKFNISPQNSAEISIIRKDGKLRILEQKQFTVKSGQNVLIAGIVRDITEKKQAELLAQKHKQQILAANTDLRLAQKIAEIGNWQLDPSVEVPIWSEYIYKIYERNPNDGPVPLSEYKKIFEPDQYQIFSNAINAAIEEGKNYDIVLKLNLPSGKTKWVRAICQPDLNNKTEKGYFLRGTIQDITDRKNNEIKLVEALERAREADRLKSVFLANMSHEIRTPMNGILGFASLLKDPELPKKELIKFVEVIEKSGGRMLSTINDLIDISRIEAGESKVVKSTFKVNEQLEYLHTFFKPEAEKKNIELILHLAKRGEEKEIFTDKDKWSAILVNLIKNAIKYTEKGTIEFGYSSLPGKLEFYVKDTGIGIAEKRLQAVFERFVQEDLTVTKPFEGAGLGLAISKGFAELLGGDIRVESQKGKGSTFYFTLDDKKYGKKEIKKKDKKEVENQNLKRLKNLTILVAEDEEFAKIYFQEILKNDCKSLIFVESGTECVEQVKNNPEIDLVLMDIKMREMDGYQATKKIREFNSKVKIIAQTAFALTGDREKALDAGCDEYIAKPVHKNQLYDLILKFF